MASPVLPQKSFLFLLWLTGEIIQGSSARCPQELYLCTQNCTKNLLAQDFPQKWSQNTFPSTDLTQADWRFQPLDTTPAQSPIPIHSDMNLCDRLINKVRTILVEKTASNEGWCFNHAICEIRINSEQLPVCRTRSWGSKWNFACFCNLLDLECQPRSADYAAGPLIVTQILNKEVRLSHQWRAHEANYEWCMASGWWWGVWSGAHW